MDEQEMLVEKILALMERTKGRDLYDVWFLLNSGVALDTDLFYEKTETKPRLENIVSKVEYERDMKKLTSRILPYEQLMREIEDELKVL